MALSVRATYLRSCRYLLVWSRNRTIMFDTKNYKPAISIRKCTNGFDPTVRAIDAFLKLSRWRLSVLNQPPYVIFISFYWYVTSQSCHPVCFKLSSIQHLVGLFTNKTDYEMLWEKSIVKDESALWFTYLKALWWIESGQCSVWRCWLDQWREIRLQNQHFFERGNLVICLLTDVDVTFILANLHLRSGIRK